MPTLKLINTEHNLVLLVYKQKYDTNYGITFLNKQEAEKHVEYMNKISINEIWKIKNETN